MNNLDSSNQNTLFLKLSQDLMCTTGYDGSFKYLNPAWEKLTGYSEKELLSQPFPMILHPDDQEEYKQQVDAFSEKRTSACFQNRCLCKDGSVIYIDWNATLVQNEKKVYWIGKNVTQYKIAETKTIEHNSDLLFLNSLAIPLADINTLDEFSKILLKGIIKHTGALLASFGYYHAEKKELQLLHIEAETGVLSTILKIAGKKVLQTVSPVDDEAYQTIVNNTVTTSKSFTEVSFGVIPEFVDKTIRASTGIDLIFPIAHVIEGELYGTTTLAFKKGQTTPSVKMLKSYAHMISVALRRYNAEKSMERSENKFRQLFENMEQGFALHEIKCNRQGKAVDYITVLVNHKYEEYLNVSYKDIVGKNASDILPGKEFHEWLKIFGEVALTGITKKYSFYSDYNKKYFDGIAYRTEKGKFAVAFSDVSDKNLAEKELIKAKERAEGSDYRLNLAVDSGKLGIWDYDIGNNTLVWNKRMYELYGLSAGKFTNSLQAWESGLHTEDKAATLAELRLALEGRKQFNTTFRVVHPDKTIVHLKADGIVIRDKNEKPVRMIGINRDITESVKQQEDLIQAKEKAEKNEIRFKAISEQAMDGIALTDLDGTYVFVNKSFCEMTGYTQQELLQLKVFDLRAEGSDTNLFEQIIKDRKKGSSARTKLLRSDKSVINVDINGSFLDLGSTQYILGIHRNVTELVNRENELIKAKEKAEENESMLMAALDNSQAGIAIADYPDGKLRYVNNAGLLIRDKSYDEIVKEIDIDKYVSSWQILHFDGTPYKTDEVPLARAVLFGEKSSKEFIVRRDNSEDRYVWANAAPIFNRKEEQIAAIVVFLDITDRKRLELDAIKAKEKAQESDLLKSAFLANMSHEIRTPMNGILGFTELLKEPDLSGEKQREYISIIEKSGDRMLNTINDIIDISKIESGQVELSFSEIDLNDLLDEQYEFFLPEARIKGIQLSLNKLPAQKLSFTSDKEKLNSILTNLIKNAIKYTHSGSIEFGYSIDDTNKQNELKFYVKDTGIGISPKRIEAIFERFVQADIEDKQVYEGSGLGLSIAKAYLEMLGGKIWVESEVGVGSAFYFTIPLDAEK
ncbi:PAS domain S-box protein [Saccharicrinis sp. FJH2]|uniref:PAS domain S-box protein n=1 Tax=Saccharicrinis sp. FJH65 TaxID=3344659 RepID=UPI0035F25887